MTEKAKGTGAEPVPKDASGHDDGDKLKSRTPVVERPANSLLGVPSQKASPSPVGPAIPPRMPPGTFSEYAFLDGVSKRDLGKKLNWLAGQMRKGCLQRIVLRGNAYYFPRMPRRRRYR